MSAVEMSIAPQATRGKRALRPATVIVGLAFTVALIFIAQHVIDAGYVRKDIQQLEAGEAWRTGGWLSQIMLRTVGFLPGVDLRQKVLALVAAAISGMLFAALYDRLRANAWLIVGSLLVVLAAASHAGALYTLTASSRGIPLLVAFAALIPAVRSMEAVGDVQSAIGLGLLLPLLLLASPITTPLILPLALGAALAEPDGRRDPRAFAAMLLVAVLPTLIVIVGIVGFLAQNGFDLADALLPYANAYSELRFGDPLGSLEALGVYAPVLIVPIAYCFWPNLPERRNVFSALMVILLPLYLVAARVVLNTTMSAMTPAVALIAAFVSWLAMARLPLGLRVFALVMLVVSAASSWIYTGFWDDPEWRAALSHLVPDGVNGLNLRFGL